MGKRNLKRKMVTGLSTVMMILLSACGNGADVSVGSSAGVSESAGHAVTDNAVTDNSSSDSMAAGGETADDVSKDNQSMAASTGETIFSKPDIWEPRDITEVTIALPSSELHDKPSQYYDRLVAAINEYTGMNVTWKWYKPSDYNKQLEEDILSGNLADVVLIDRSEVFLEAMEDGLFWEVGPYIDEYDNLSTIPEGARISVSYNGKMYGIPCSGGTVSDGIGYRVDWLEKLGLEEPTDWESFCEMLYAFTYNDPDGNGVDDTVGLLLDAFEMRWDVMESWFGVPNVWGVDENGNLIHKSQTEEYRNAYKAFRELYAQGLINSGKNGVANFRELTGSMDLRKAIQNSQGGCIIDNMLNFSHVQDYFVQQGVTTEDNLIIQLQASVDTGLGPHCYSGIGTGEMLVVSTDGVREEAHFKQILQFLNDVNDGVCKELILYGWENETYAIYEDGLADFYIMNESDDATIFTYRTGFSEIEIDYVAEENKGTIVTFLDVRPIAILREQLIQENSANCVINYGYQFMGAAETESLEALDALLFDIEMKYVTGEIDDAGFKAALSSWMENGGEELTQGLNEKYHAAGY